MRISYMIRYLTSCFSSELCSIEGIEGGEAQVAPSGVVVRQAVVPPSLDVDGHQVTPGELQWTKDPTCSTPSSL